VTDAPTDNSAGRLFALLRAIKDADENQQTYSMLRSILGTEMQPDNALFHELAALINLAGETHNAISRQSDANPGLLLRWQSNFNQLLKSGYLGRGNEPISLVQKYVTDADLLALEMCADLLHRREPEVVIPEERLPDLVKLVRELIDAVSEADELPASIRLHLLSRLQDVEYALIHIRTTGFAGVEAAIDKLAGTIIREPEARKAEEKLSLWRRIWAAITLAAEGTKAVGSSAEVVAKAISTIHELNP
jgi:hypothetical protein